MPVALSTMHTDVEWTNPVRKTGTSDRDVPAEMPTALSLGGFLRQLHPFSTRQHFARNEVIFRDGDKAESVYRMISGTVRLCRHMPSGTRQILDFVMEGEMIGIAGYNEHPFSAEAVTPVTLTAYPRHKFDDFVESMPAMRAHLTSLLTSDLATTGEHLPVSASQSAKQRLATFLVRLAERTDTDPGERLELPMGRLDIADHLGVTTEALCRAIAALRDERILVVPNSNQLIVSNIVALKTLAADA
jgi:CRP/FNR family transcriptional regulator, anaerobic regulatory protein